MDTDLAELKDSLRIAMRRQLAVFPLTERSVASWRAIDRLIAMPWWEEVRQVLLFAPLPVEPDLDLLWIKNALAGKIVAYPRVGGMKMRLFFVEDLAELETTRWGLREPPPSAAREADLRDFDLALVPGLAFDRAGGRLGRGGGYYDRLLVDRPKEMRTVGMAFAGQLLEQAIPRDKHDLAVDAVCTDAEFHSVEPPLESYLG